MATNQNTTESTTGTTVPADIGTVICEVTDILSTAQDGISALLTAATDSGDDFANVVSWMSKKIGEDIDTALSMVEAAHNACRTASIVLPDEAKLANATEAAERLRAFAVREDERFPHVRAQAEIDNAVADAIFVLAKAQRWGTLQPIIEGLTRAGLLADVERMAA